jgi:signal transduction histidine kinase
MVLLCLTNLQKFISLRITPSSTSLAPKIPLPDSCMFRSLQKLDKVSLSFCVKLKSKKLMGRETIQGRTGSRLCISGTSKEFQDVVRIVTGRSRAWTDDQMESAGVLPLIYGKFIQVRREKQSAMASNQLTAILLSNTSHAVRTPLSQIINTLELALSGDIDQDTRSMLENSHQASRALLFHVHDLLDLERIETGNETAFNDPFDLRMAVQNAIRL